VIGVRSEKFFAAMLPVFLALQFACCLSLCAAEAPAAAEAECAQGCSFSPAERECCVIDSDRKLASIAQVIQVCHVVQPGAARTHSPASSLSPPKHSGEARARTLPTVSPPRPFVLRI
jgi:hypothetical protein